VILRCLAKPPADRYQTTAALAEALNRCQTADGWSAKAAAQWWRMNEKELPTVPDAEPVGVGETG
jgi:serine/threonine-protein kinase